MKQRNLVVPETHCSLNREENRKLLPNIQRHVNEKKRLRGLEQRQFEGRNIISQNYLVVEISMEKACGISKTSANKIKQTGPEGKDVFECYRIV